MKLIYVNTVDAGSKDVLVAIPFEYESKEKFITDVNDKYDKIKNSIFVLDFYFSPYDILHLKDTVCTLEEWFESNKIIKIL